MPMSHDPQQRMERAPQALAGTGPPQWSSARDCGVATGKEGRGGSKARLPDRRTNELSGSTNNKPRERE